jgi:hypothetical protein
MSYSDSDMDVMSELRAEDAADRRRRARLWHWCATCHGHTGPGSPCAPDDEPDEQEEETQ